MAVDGLDDTSDAIEWADLLGRPGQRTRYLASIEGDATAAAGWCQRLGWPQRQTFLVSLDGPPLSTETLSEALEHENSRPLLAALTTAVGWLPRRLLWRTGDRSLLSSLRRLDGIIVEQSGCYALASNATRRHLSEKFSTTELNRAADLLLAEESSYRTLYEGAHRRWQRAPARQWQPMVSPRRWSSWRHFTHAYGGIIGDLEGARVAALGELTAGTAPASLELALRSALVEASLNSLAGEAADEAALGARPVTGKRQIGDFRKQSKALRAIARGLMEGVAREEVLAASLGAANRILNLEQRADELIALASVWPSKRLELAREAIELIEQVPRPDALWSLLLVTPLLSEAESSALARRVWWRASELGLDPSNAIVFAAGLPSPTARALWKESSARSADDPRELLAALALASNDRDMVAAAFEHLVQHLARAQDEAAWQALLRLVPQLDVGQLRRALSISAQNQSRREEDLLVIGLRLIDLGAFDEALVKQLTWKGQLTAWLRQQCVTGSRGGELLALLSTLRAADYATRFELIFMISYDLIALGEITVLVELCRDFEPPARLSAMAFIAERAPPDEATPLAREAFFLGQMVSTDETQRLQELAPLAHLLPRPQAVWLFGRLLDEIGGNLRGSALAGDGVCVAALVPLLQTLEGDAGLALSARCIIEVVSNWP